ncbi:MAG: cob(I)yrinic acid a,c-diamide adenosyltransferase, partial [Firmicutes bacterium]|nr:cob(I)yrinic acid a,c-diamide adenosyltransferase [Bacillota bacterium]
IHRDRVLDFLKNKPEHLEIVLTGRDPEEEIAELASYISDIQKVKHPYDTGVPFRKGIEH